MVILRSGDIRSMSETEVEKNLNQLKDELSKMKADIASGSGAEKSGRIKEIKKTIARILTIRSQQNAGQKSEEQETKKQ